MSLPSLSVHFVPSMARQPGAATSSSPLRVLVRTPPSSSSNSAPPKPSPSNTPPLLPDGVVVVGFLGSSPRIDVTHLINRILDADVFGLGNLDSDFPRSGEETKVEVEEWFRDRRISYFYAKEKGIVFLQFSVGVESLGRLGRDDACGIGGEELRLEEQEAGDLRGFLFMFLVCHVIIFLHEGLHFDTNILKRFRMLQAAKNELAPFIRTEVAPVITSKAPAPLSHLVAPAASRSPARAGSGRHSSAASPLSGSGSYPSIFPGQYTPVILFVFLGEFLYGSNSSSNAEDSAVSSLNQSSSLSGAKPSFPLKGSSSVVMLARPMSRSEGSFKKKLHSALDSQIRFLIKKCRTLVSTEFSGSRAVGNATLPLFTLDTSRAVALLDRSINCRGKPLDIVTNLVENLLNSKTKLDAFMLENYYQDLQYDDVQTLKDFINRQSDSLRGKGALPTNTSSGSASGVGIVAAAAAAAAASAAAAGKTSSAPKLPTMETWISSSNLILITLLSVRQPVDDIGSTSRTNFHGNSIRLKDQKKFFTRNNHAEVAISCLESSRGLNLKFSILCCQRALPAAKDVYLKDLPACFPTSIHMSQLKKALHSFQLMVKGPAVPLFAKKLEDDCISIWEAGRQLCDTVSLTGKPCMHQRHSVDILGSTSTEPKQHSSGYVFLHACACGRSRHFRDDPFDFDAANVSFNCFPNCENFLPSLALPKGNLAGPLGASWKLVRLGSSRYYDASKGLLQSGFCYHDKYLSKWTIKLEQQKENNADVVSIYLTESSKTVASKVSATEKETRKGASGLVTQEVSTTNTEHSKKVTDSSSTEGSSIHFGRGFPSVMKKAFSEVVAGTNSVNLSFSALQHKKQTMDGLESSFKQVGTNYQNNSQVHASNNHQKIDKADFGSIQYNKDEYASVLDVSNDIRSKCDSVGDPFLQIGDNVVHINTNGDEKLRQNHSPKEISIHVGFEHECPHGHRFLLSEEHLKDLVLHHPGEERYQLYSTVVSNVRISDDEHVHVNSLLNRNLPIYMNCPYCKNSMEKRKNIKFASTVSQLQRIFLVTPPFPIVLASCPIIQFETSCLPTSVLDPEHQSRFSPGCQVILPPESFITFRLPFVYGVQVDDKLHPVNYMEQHPELTAWLVKGTTLQLVSKEFNPDVFQMP